MSEKESEPGLREDERSLREDVYLYARAKYEVVAYRASQAIAPLFEPRKVSRFKTIGQTLATLHLGCALLLIGANYVIPDLSNKIFAMGMWKVAPLAAPATNTFTGFLDTFNTQGATWGVSAYKLTRGYGGAWGTVKRQSDSATLQIGFNAMGKVDVASFNTFCAGTNCVLNSWVDQINGVNASDASTAGVQARVIVDGNSLLAVCPQPKSKMTTAFNAGVNTAKIHAFIVAKAAYADSRWSQADVATVTVTGNVTINSTAVTAMSSQTAISLVVNSGQTGLPGVVDSAGKLPYQPTLGTVGQTFLSALPTGSTATLGYSPGNVSSTGSQTGDTLTFTNAAFSGAWISNGPATTNYTTSAYWGIGLAAVSDNSVSNWYGPRNGDGYVLWSLVGQGMRGAYGVYDYDTFTGNLSYNGVALGNFGNTNPNAQGQPANANITYSTNVGMTLFADASGNEVSSQACFETIVLFPATEAARVTMAQFLMAQDSISFPFAPNTSDGFAMTGNYQTWRPWANSAANSVYGAATFGPDANGITWDMQTGGYTWPSVAYATNINNGGTLMRFILQTQDSDTTITQAERAETCAHPTCQTGSGGLGVVAPGQSFSQFAQFRFEQYQSQTGDWCDINQIHYNNALGNSAPDIFSLSCLGNNLQIVTQKGAGPTTTNCGSAVTLTQGVTYSLVITGFWSTNHTSDTLDAWLATNGTTLTHVCSTSGALWDNDTGAYLKAGIYRGFPNANLGTLILRVMNVQWSLTANAFSAFITSQPALPTHP